MRKLFWLVVFLPLTTSADNLEVGPGMKLYLTSAGAKVLDQLVPLLPLPPSGHTACYVPTAATLDGSPPWVDEEIEAIEKTGFDVRSIDLAELAANSAAGAFTDCDVIWVGGGNTYHLLREARRSGFDDFVVKRIADGVPYVGASAGSLLLAPNIECIKYAEDPDSHFDLESYDALNVFPLVTFVHFDNPDFRDVYRKIVIDALENDVAFITLRDNQFIYVDGANWRIVDSN